MFLHYFRAKRGLYKRKVAIVNIPTESAQGWKQVFQDIKERVIVSTGLIISDGLAGLDGAIGELFPKTPHQKCIVHLQRNIQAYVKTEHKKELTSDVRYTLSPDDKEHTKEAA